ncbi:MAG: hypothetical protein A2939_01295 [Parcubacteria group bacterium RIFCSPLOWO2_01_FULL_48_18]|nr:MAG: hypothetical protein A2939_01295 [Parcubacteria group bacterium RIFCSPLOWO2_01_FULL_48_18]OHB23861.1 MAG: hypothetical protein A3J67_03200 [Parcubacteria group bacterium RIFCSPHIGHO2_02_FULL_48_10b]
MDQKKDEIILQKKRYHPYVAILWMLAFWGSIFFLLGVTTPDLKEMYLKNKELETAPSQIYFLFTLSSEFLKQPLLLIAAATFITLVIGFIFLSDPEVISHVVKLFSPIIIVVAVFVIVVIGMPMLKIVYEIVSLSEGSMQ